MPEKLLTVKEASILLGVSEGGLEKLVKGGELPAYKIGGQFLRFRREQIEAIRSELLARGIKPKPSRLVGHLPKPPKVSAKEFSKQASRVEYQESISDRISDFFYFNDFYVITGLLTVIILWVIFQ